MNPTILLVDMASHDRENWKAFLTRHNYDVLTADNAESARLLCHCQHPDLVLLHDHSPHMRGPDLCRQLKQDPLNQLTPVVVVSPKPALAELAEAREAGAAGFWSTPASLGEEIGHIESMLRLRSCVDEQAKSVILSVAQSVESCHSRTGGHSDRLARYAHRLGEHLGLSEDDLQELRLGCLLHDIGKLAVPDSILLKPGSLTAEEMEIVRQHPATGETICAPVKCLRPILPIIRHHHERMNGSGYPDGLRGEEIPLKARILQVADVFDALTSNRAYRKALPSAQALQILRQEATYGWLDASLVWKFSRMRPSANRPTTNWRRTVSSYLA